MAGYYLKDLHRVLIFLKSLGWLAEADIVLHVLNSGTLMGLYKVWNYNLHILNDFFVLPTKAGFTLVIEWDLGIIDYWYQFEYSISRGIIHFHSFLINRIKSKFIHTLFNKPLESLNVQQLKNLDDKVSEYLAGIFLKHLAPIYYLHLAGRKNTRFDTTSTASWYKQQKIYPRGKLLEYHAKHFWVWDVVPYVLARQVYNTKLMLIYIKKWVKFSYI